MKEYLEFIVKSKELNRDVKIYIYLPDNYNSSNESYPVIYINDGQVLFNDEDDKSWGMMDKYVKDKDKENVILVGIVSCETRVNELSPFPVYIKQRDMTVGGFTDKYMAFIIDTLKPLINKKFRTKLEPSSTSLLGISLGGVCSLYTAAKYPEHFTRIASVSTASGRVIEQLLDLLDKSDFSHVDRLYLDVGTKESENEAVSQRYVESNKRTYKVLKEKISEDKLQFNIIEGSEHKEEYWNERLPEIISFILS